MNTKTMHAVLIEKTGDVDELRLKQTLKPKIERAGELLIRLQAAGVNPIDTKVRKGSPAPESLPAILGCDGAGIVEETGPEVKGLKVGDSVYFFYGGLGREPGTYAEYIVIDEHAAVPKPKSLDFIHAAAAPLALLTAWESLHDRARIQPGQTVLIHAGAGGVGHLAIQLAKIAGARVLTTVGSAEKAAFVASLGADEAILYKERDFVDVVMALTDGVGVDVAMDNVGGALFEATFPAVRYYGDVVTLLQPGQDVDWLTARMRNLRISLEIMLTPRRFGLTDALLHQQEILKACANLINKGLLRVHVSQILTLGGAAKAHQLLENGSTTGKIVLQIGEE